jgi:signal transduction histidine kinase
MRLGASLRNKLALVFLAITAAAFGVLYFFVVPQLETNLRDKKVDDLERAAAASKPTLENLMGRRDVSAAELDARVRSVSDGAAARVTLLGVQQSAEAGRPQFYVISDSREEARVPENVPLAERAVRRRKLQRDVSVPGGEQLGQVAQPLTYRGQVDWTALYTRDFADVNETVSFIRDRLLLATAVALLVALIGGTLVAQALARRVKRLEVAAEEVAAGRFVEPLPVDSADELGQLTRAFNEMQSQLRRVDVARKEFVATASHELRTPIFSLGGFVELLRDEELDAATRREFLETMTEQVERLQKLAVDLLDLSRLDAGSVELQLERVDLTEVARAVAGEFVPAAQTHHTELDLRLPSEGVPAECDRERVVQILRILLDNALRHTPEGTDVTVTASTHNGAAAITVADQGPGLPAGKAVFERFATGDAARGAGLGLAIALELAERMDGKLRAGEPGAGAQFTLELPTTDGGYRA